jgi:hypothetical protein
MFLDAKTPKGLHRIIKIGSGQLCLREKNNKYMT